MENSTRIDPVFAAWLVDHLYENLDGWQRYAGDRYVPDVTEVDALFAALGVDTTRGASAVASSGVAADASEIEDDSYKAVKAVLIGDGPYADGAFVHEVAKQAAALVDDPESERTVAEAMGIVATDLWQAALRVKEPSR